MTLWIVLFCALLIGIFWFFIFTPYPFVLLLRRDKGEKREKGPKNIEEIRSRIQIQCDEEYPSKYPNHTFDCYWKKDPKRILVWVHGGSFIAGTSAGARNFAAMLADDETMVCAINYAYAPKYAFPVQIRQVDEFLTYLPTYLKRERIALDLPVFIGGDSAGANIALAFTCMRVHPELCKKANVNLKSSQTVKGNLLFCGPYDFCEDVHRPEFASFQKVFRYLGWSYLGHRKWEMRKEKEWASPYHQISEANPPMYVCDGKKVSFAWQGMKLVEKATSMQVDVVSKFYDEMPHEFQFEYQKYAKEAMEVYADSNAFLKKYTM